MKLFLAGMIALLSVQGIAAPTLTSPQECLKIKNALDKKYCLDKNLETVKAQQANEKKNWTNGLAAKDKQDKMAASQNAISSKKEYITYLQNELALEEKHLEALKGAPVAKEAKKKKEKKKKGFRIKL